MTVLSRRTALRLLGAAPVAAGAVAATSGTAYARSPGLAERIQGIIDQPVFHGSHWGMAFYAPDTDEIVYAANPAELFVAGSSLKVFIAGTAFEALGASHRFRTRIRRTGPVVRGVLRGDLVLVAGGDLLLAGRSRPDGTLLLPDTDPSYPGQPPLPDPLREIRGLAGQVAAAGVRRVDGRVLVDISLFAEAREGIAFNDTMITVSPMMVGDNVVHAVVTPGAAAGEPGVVRSAVPTNHVRFVSQVQTVAGAPARQLAVTDDVINPDGTHTVTVTGDIPVGAPTQYTSYFVLSPTTYAAAVLTEALRARGVHVDGAGVGGHPRGPALAEHVSLPLSEQVKPMLKSSSNVHTATFPYVVGAGSVSPKETYEQYRRQLFRAAGLDPDPAGATDGKYTAETFIKFLAHMRRRPYFTPFHRALPILGRDGSLAGNQPNSPAAGHVYAKTGTAMMMAPSGVGVVNKALAGYIELPNGRWLTFAQFMNQEGDMNAARDLAGKAQEAMAEIAAAVYETLGRTSR
ncbi:D-alanyl-D-alanine carboxypeptidase/D-alanyl-D-alanine endopeptidase [Actinophytocola sp.]|uniref:D-alanyl-D-alanine carboxypeptidase/D-alanyl-D-alanine endopeptidase n=1 Tax=Actinophytocola sp. TaxID=1872138 RepID=UPI002ED26C9C